MSDFLLLLLVLVLFRGEGFGNVDLPRLMMNRFMGDAGRMPEMFRGFLQGEEARDPGSLMKKLTELTAGMDPGEVESIKNAALGALGKGTEEPMATPATDGFGQKLLLLEALIPLLSPRQAHMVREVAGGMRSLRSMETGAAEWKL